MSKKESKKRLKRRSKGYRRAMIVINVFFLLFIISFGVYGALHTFTKKKEYRNKGVWYYNDKQYDIAIELFDKALSEDQWFSDKLDADILLYKAECQVMLKQYDAASATYKRLRNYPDYVMDEIDLDLLIKINSSFIMFDSGEYSNALSGFVEGYDAGYENLSLYAGICYENLGDLDNMHKYYNYYKRFNGADSFLCYKEAVYFMSIDDINVTPTNEEEQERLVQNCEKALAAIATGLKLDTGEYDRELRFAEIICHEKMLMYSQAFEEIRIYLERYPDDDEGKKLYDFLETRVEPDTEVVNPIFENIDNNITE